MKNLLSKLSQKIAAIVFLFFMALPTSFAISTCSPQLMSTPEHPCPRGIIAGIVCVNLIVDPVCTYMGWVFSVADEVVAIPVDASVLFNSQQNAINMAEKYRQEFERVSGELQKYTGSATPLDHALNVLDSNSDNKGVFKTTINQTKSGVSCSKDYKLILSPQATKDVDACLLNVYPKLSSTKCPISDDASNTVQNIQARADCIKNQASYANALKEVTNDYLKCTWACVNINGSPIAMHTYALNNPGEQYQAMLNNNIFQSATFKTGVSAGLQVANTVDGVVSTATTIGNGIATTAATIQNVAGTISNLSQQVQAQMAPKPQIKKKS